LKKKVRIIPRINKEKYYCSYFSGIHSDWITISTRSFIRDDGEKRVAEVPPPPVVNEDLALADVEAREKLRVIGFVICYRRQD
jgi:hypothetical protein